MNLVSLYVVDVARLSQAKQNKKALSGVILIRFRQVTSIVKAE